MRFVESEVDIVAPEVLELYRYWCKSGGVTCLSDDFDLLEIPDLLPLVLMVAPNPADDDMFIHYIGNVVVKNIRRDLTATPLSQWKPVYPLAWQTITETALTGRPHIYGPAHAANPDIEFRVAEHLALPFAKDKSEHHSVIYCPYFG